MRTSARRDASVLMMEDPEQPPSTGPPATLGSARDPRALHAEPRHAGPRPVESGRVEVGVAAQVRAPAGGDRAALVRFAEGALDALGRSSAELSVLLCDDGFMRDLNLRFRGIDAPTDVLSFEQDLTVGCGSIPGDSILGDVVISLDTARRQARRRNLSEATEIRELLLHGILHLLGRDHGDGDIADEPMLQEQRRLLESLPWASCAAS